MVNEHGAYLPMGKVEWYLSTLSCIIEERARGTPRRVVYCAAAYVGLGLWEAVVGERLKRTWEGSLAFRRGE